jgi:hypothetical protein
MDDPASHQVCCMLSQNFASRHDIGCRPYRATETLTQSGDKMPLVIRRLAMMSPVLAVSRRPPLSVLPVNDEQCTTAIKSANLNRSMMVISGAVLAASRPATRSPPDSQNDRATLLGSLKGPFAFIGQRLS